MTLKISFILVEPAVPANVGAAARAIKTMGFDDLRLVNPCDHLSMEARMLAHASNEILENAKIFSTLKEALADIDFSIATSAKKRNVKEDILLCPDLPAFLSKKSGTIHHLAIVFGREESGLTNEEISLCHRISKVPLQTYYPSLNLAQSVMIYAYELSEFSIKGLKQKKFHPASEASMNALLKRINVLLHHLDLGPNRLIYGRIMERLTELGRDDVNLIHSITGKLLDALKLEDPKHE
ncbi:MAG: tRNA/rRNA methyltransferase [Bacteroidales bacterium]